MLVNKESENFDINKLKEISPYLMKALDNDPENVYLRSVNALYLYFLDKKEEALKVLNNAPNDSDIAIKEMKAILFIEFKEYEKAWDIVKDIPDERLILNLKIRCLYNLEKYDEVITQADKYLENYSENTDVVDYRNKSLEKLGMDIRKESKANLNEDLICDDDKSNIYYVKSNNLIYQGEYEKALKCIEKGLEITPNHLPLANNKVFVLLKFERYDEVDKFQDFVFDLVIARDKVEGSLIKAIKRFYTGKFKECIELCYDVLDIDKDNADAIFLMISSIYGLEDLRELPQALLRLTIYDGDDIFS